MGMGTRRRRERQEQMWIAHQELANGPAHPFYQRVNELLEEKKFDEFAEERVRKILRREERTPVADTRNLFSFRQQSTRYRFVPKPFAVFPAGSAVTRVVRRRRRITRHLRGR